MTLFIPVNAGQPGSALNNLVTAGIEIPNVVTQNPNSNPTVGVPVAVEVGATVKSDGGRLFLHTAFCSSITYDPKTGRIGKGGQNSGTKRNVGFVNRVAPFMEGAHRGQSGVYRFFGDVIGCDDPDIAFRVRAAVFLPVPGFDPDSYEFAGSTPEALRTLASDRFEVLKHRGLQIDDMDNIYGPGGYANRLFQLLGEPLLVPQQDEYGDPMMRSAAVKDWMPVGAA